MNDGLEITSMRESADTVVGILKSLANSDRLLILCHLSQQELNYLLYFTQLSHIDSTKFMN